MKNFTKLFKAIPVFIALFTISVGISSCTKDPIGDNSTPAYITGINASATAQDFYVDNAKLGSSSLGYGQSIGYVSYTPGTHQLQFKTATTSTINNSTTLNAVSAGFYSIFYTDDKSAVVVADDRIAPQTGQARVRFINLATANITFDIGLANSTKRIVTGLPYKTSSTFSDFPAGSTFTLYAASGATVLLNMPAKIEANNIYTVYIAGATQATLDYQTITQD